MGMSEKTQRVMDLGTATFLASDEVSLALLTVRSRVHCGMGNLPPAQIYEGATIWEREEEMSFRSSHACADTHQP